MCHAVLSCVHVCACVYMSRLSVLLVYFPPPLIFVLVRFFSLIASQLQAMYHMLCLQIRVDIKPSLRKPQLCKHSRHLVCRFISHALYMPRRCLFRSSLKTLFFIFIRYPTPGYAQYTAPEFGTAIPTATIVDPPMNAGAAVAAPSYK